MQEDQSKLQIDSILQQTQSISFEFFSLVEMMQAYFNQRIAETMLNVQQQERQLTELKKGQAEEDIKLCQLISENQSISQSIQRQIDSLNERNNEIYLQHSQTLLLPVEDTIVNETSERQQVLDQLVQQSMNAIDVGVKVQKQNSVQYEAQFNTGFHN